mmetsp:Transcript_22885/g.46594  ORF Transcript_22885/g.46594 Transcript_22885/m.46594 type:complete len:89 (+) Transcript_22885:1210-1476(+)
MFGMDFSFCWWSCRKWYLPRLGSSFRYPNWRYCGGCFDRMIKRLESNIFCKSLDSHIPSLISRGDGRDHGSALSYYYWMGSFAIEGKL